MNKKFIVILSLILLLLIFFLVLHYTNRDINFEISQLPRYSTQYKNPDFNVVFISIETLRAGHLGCYGYNRNTTPNIDNLAKEGIIFENCLSQAPWTIPSVVSFLFSRNVLNNDVCSKGSGTENYVSLPDILRENNVLTGAIIAHKGFEFLRNRFDYFDYINVNKWSIDDEDLTDKAIEWMENNIENKFFLWLHYWTPHANYIPPKPYNTMYSTAYEGVLKDEKCDIQEVNRLKNKLSDDDIDYLISQYDGEIRYTDEILKRLFERLQELGIFGKTLIVICSDHGEGFGERNHFGHSLYLYDEFIHTPLIIMNPLSDLKNVKISNQVRNLDISPTILDVLGIEQPESFEGISLYKIMAEGLSPSAFSRTYPPCELNKLFCLQKYGHKIIYQYSLEYSNIMLPFLKKGDYKLIIRALPLREGQILSVYFNHRLLSKIPMSKGWKEYQLSFNLKSDGDDKNMLMFKSDCYKLKPSVHSSDDRILGIAFDRITFIHEKTRKKTKINIGVKSTRNMLFGGWHGNEKDKTHTFVWSYQTTEKPAELYDIRNDPKEKNTLSKKFPKVTNRLLKELMLFISSDLIEAPERIDKETIEKLKSLGYLN